jgi:hypothetical protein
MMRRRRRKRRRRKRRRKTRRKRRRKKRRMRRRKRRRRKRRKEDTNFVTRSSHTVKTVKMGCTNGLSEGINTYIQNFNVEIRRKVAAFKTKYGMGGFFFKLKLYFY